MELIAIVISLIVAAFAYKKIYKGSLEKDPIKWHATIRAAFASLLVFVPISVASVFVLDVAANGLPKEKKPLTNLKGGYPLCASETLFDEMTTAYVNQDINQRAYLYEHGCLKSSEDIGFSVVDMGFGTAKVRIYLPNGESAVMWTNREAVTP